MEFVKGIQIGPEKLDKVEFDIVFGVSTKGERSSFLFKQFPIKSKKQIALKYSKNNLDLIKRSKKDFFLENDFELMEVNYGNNDLPINYLKSFLKSNQQDSINILIDISCMDKRCYTGFILLLDEIENLNSIINVYFSYTPAKYGKKKKNKIPKSYDSLLPGHEAIHKDKPTCLIIGLGLYQDYADYIKNKINPDSLVLFYSDPAPEGYVEDLFENNRELIEKVDVKDLHNYPIDDMHELSNTLTNICLNLRLKKNIIIFPTGPKVFTLASLLLAIRYPDIDVLNLRNDSYQPLSNNVAVSGLPIIYHVIFEEEKE